MDATGGTSFRSAASGIAARGMMDLPFWVQTVKSQILRRLPPDAANRAREAELVHHAKRLIKELSEINLELAQVLIADDDVSGKKLPDWFMLEIVRDLPRLAAQKD